MYLLRERTELLYLKDEQNLDKIMWGEDGCWCTPGGRGGAGWGTEVGTP